MGQKVFGQQAAGKKGDLRLCARRRRLLADELQQLLKEPPVDVDRISPVAAHVAHDEREQRTRLLRL